MNRAAIRGLGIAFAAFAAAFALHIVGGATDQGWLFAAAVVLIYISATAYPAIALWLSGLSYRDGQVPRLAVGMGVGIGLLLTMGTLWATNDRSFGPVVFVLTPVLTAVSTAAVLTVRGWVEGGSPRRAERSSLT